VQKNQISTPFQAVGKAIKWVATLLESGALMFKSGTLKVSVSYDIFHKVSVWGLASSLLLCFLAVRFGW
jgi:hypothetical protein